MGNAYNKDLSTTKKLGHDSVCLTNEFYDDYTNEGLTNLFNRRKNVRKLMANNLDREELDTLYVPVVFHNVYQIDGNPMNSFCDYQVDSNVYGNDNENVICQQRAETALEILNEQFSPIKIIFIPHPDTSLVIEAIENEKNYISTANSSTIINYYNIPNSLNIYLVDCIRENINTENCRAGKRAFATIPDKLASYQRQGIVLIHSCVPGMNEDRVGTLAHEIGHVFTLLHLFHWPEIKIDITTDSSQWIKDPNFQIELVSGTNCEARGDGICDTPGQPLFSINEAFDLENCVYHGFDGEFDSVTDTLKIGGSSKSGSFVATYDTTTNLIATSNQDEVGDFWGTRELPELCFINNQDEFATKCLYSFYKYIDNNDSTISTLPSATNFLQVANINDICLR